MFEQEAPHRFHLNLNLTLLFYVNVSLYVLNKKYLSLVYVLYVSLFF